MNTRKELIELFAALTQNAKIGNAKFKYGCLKNLRIINADIESLKEIEKEIGEILVDYNEKRNEIIKKYGEVNEQGQVSISRESENFDLAIKELEELGVEFKDTLELFNTKTNEYNELLEEEIKFDFTCFEISIDNIPDEVIKLDILMDFNIVK